MCGPFSEVWTVPPWSAVAQFRFFGFYASCCILFWGFLFVCWKNIALSYSGFGFESSEFFSRFFWFSSAAAVCFLVFLLFLWFVSPWRSNFVWRIAAKISIADFGYNLVHLPARYLHWWSLRSVVVRFFGTSGPSLYEYTFSGVISFRWCEVRRTARIIIWSISLRIYLHWCLPIWLMWGPSDVVEFFLLLSVHRLCCYAFWCSHVVGVRFRRGLLVGPSPCGYTFIGVSPFGWCEVRRTLWNFLFIVGPSLVLVHLSLVFSRSWCEVSFDGTVF